jgi:hypothetical protein
VVRHLQLQVHTVSPGALKKDGTSIMSSMNKYVASRDIPLSSKSQKSDPDSIPSRSHERKGWTFSLIAKQSTPGKVILPVY